VWRASAGRYASPVVESAQTGLKPRVRNWDLHLVPIFPKDGTPRRDTGLHPMGRMEADAWQPVSGRALNAWFGSIVPDLGRKSTARVKVG
jgi:hypothetical protein